MAFCTHTILQDDVLVVPDARQDRRFSDSPLVTGVPSLRFYAGAPIKAPNGDNMGTLCVLDTVPRLEFDVSLRETLQDLAALVVHELETRLTMRGLRAQAEVNRAGQERLVSTENQLRLIVKNVPAAVAVFDREMRYLTVSQHWVAACLPGNQPVIGRTHYQVFANVSDDARQLHQRCLTGEVVSCDQEDVVRADGVVGRLRCQMHPWHHADGKVGGMVMIIDPTPENVVADSMRSIAVG